MTMHWKIALTRLNIYPNTGCYFVSPWPKAGLGVIIVSLLVRESHRSNRAAGERRWLLGPEFRRCKGDLKLLTECSEWH